VREWLRMIENSSSVLFKLAPVFLGLGWQYLKSSFLDGFSFKSLNMILELHTYIACWILRFYSDRWGNFGYRASWSKGALSLQPPEMQCSPSSAGGASISAPLSRRSWMVSKEGNILDAAACIEEGCCARSFENLDKRRSARTQRVYNKRSSPLD